MTRAEDAAVADDFRWEKDQVFRTINSMSPPEQRRYLLRRYLGGGSTSFVWLAHELTDVGDVRRPVALKVLKPRTSNEPPSEWEWRCGAFEDEIRVLNELWEAEEEELGDGWHAVPELYDYSPRDVSPAYLAMEYVDTDLLPAVDELARFEGGLSEEEVLDIGIQVCRLLQLLHDNKRSYKDFQLQNVHWNRRARRIKVIDWNVVTQRGQANVERDLVRLASYLVWLRTLYQPPESGVRPRVLAARGGAPWNRDTSRAFRLVLERALSPDSSERSPGADALGDVESGQKPGLRPMEELGTLGEVLREVRRWRQADVNQLVGVAGTCMSKQMFSEARAAVELARAQAEEMPDVAQGSRKILDALWQAVTGKEDGLRGSESDPLRRGQEYLAIGAVGMALDALQSAVDEQDDLEARRWLAMAQAVKGLPRDEIKPLWERRLLQDTIAALQEERWGDAVELTRSPDWGFDLQRLKTLRTDALINMLAAEAEKLWLELSASADAGKAQDLQAKLGQLDELRRTGLPYWHLIDERWPDIDRWQRQAESVRRREGEISSAAAEVRQAFELSVETGTAVLRGKLSVYPGHPLLLRVAQEQGKRLLTEQCPGEASIVLREALRHATADSPTTQLLARDLDTAETWTALRGAVNAGDWEIARQQAAVLEGLEGIEALKPALRAGIQRWLDTFIRNGEIERAEQTIAAARALNLPVDYYADQVQSLKQRRREEATRRQEEEAKRRREEDARRWQDVFLTVAEKERLGDETSLEEAASLARNLREALDLGDPRRDRVSETVERIELRIIQLRTQRQRSKAAEAERTAEARYRDGQEVGDFRAAETLFRQAEQLYRETGDQEDAQRASGGADRALRTAQRNEEVVQRLGKASKYLEICADLEDEPEPDAQENISGLLAVAARSVLSAEDGHPGGARVQALKRRVDEMARRAGLPEESVWQPEAVGEDEGPPTPDEGRGGIKRVLGRWLHDPGFDRVVVAALGAFVLVVVISAIWVTVSGIIPTSCQGPQALPTDTPVLPPGMSVPTDTPLPPADTPVPPADTPVPPTDTPVLPTDTPVLPTDTPVPPTDTPLPPTDTPMPPIPTPVSSVLAFPPSGKTHPVMPWQVVVTHTMPAKVTLALELQKPDVALPGPIPVTLGDAPFPPAILTTTHPLTLAVSVDMLPANGGYIYTWERTRDDLRELPDGEYILRVLLETDDGEVEEAASRLAIHFESPPFLERTTTAWALFQRRPRSEMVSIASYPSRPVLVIGRAEEAGGDRWFFCEALDEYSYTIRDSTIEVEVGERGWVMQQHLADSADLQDVTLLAPTPQ